MFKKFFFASALAFGLAFPAFSQSNGSGYKPETGDVTAEVQLNLFNGSTISMDQIRGRYFITPLSAFRLGLNFSSNNYTVNDLERKQSVLGIAPGIEKHFAGTDRLSPYVGAEITLAKTFVSEEGPNSEVKNGWSQGNGTRANFSSGLRVLAGADFYVARRLFLGVEFGIGFTNTSYSEVEARQGNSILYTSEEYSSFSFGTNARSGIRVGFAF